MFHDQPRFLCFDKDDEWKLSKKSMGRLKGVEGKGEVLRRQRGPQREVQISLFTGPHSLVLTYWVQCNHIIDQKAALQAKSCTFSCVFLCPGVNGQCTAQCWRLCTQLATGGLYCTVTSAWLIINQGVSASVIRKISYLIFCGRLEQIACTAGLCACWTVPRILGHSMCPPIQSQKMVRNMILYVSTL